MRISDWSSDVCSSDLRIDRHTWQLFKGVGLSTLLSVGTELGWGESESDLVRAIREPAQQSGSRAGDQLVPSNLDIQPTLRIRPGWPLRVVLHKDIVMDRAWGGSHGCTQIAEHARPHPGKDREQRDDGRGWSAETS